MPRILTIPSAEYQPGIRSGTIEGFLPDSKGMRATFTRESWGGQGTGVLHVRVRGVNTLRGIDCICVELWFPGGTILDRAGNPQATSWVQWEWPGESDGSGGRQVIPMDSIEVLIENTITLRTAIRIEQV